MVTPYVNPGVVIDNNRWEEVLDNPGQGSKGDKVCRDKLTVFSLVGTRRYQRISEQGLDKTCR